jgi:hypothetical protein
MATVRAMMRSRSRSHVPAARVSANLAPVPHGRRGFFICGSLTLPVFARGHKTSGALRSNPNLTRIWMPEDRGRMGVCAMPREDLAEPSPALAECAICATPKSLELPGGRKH